MIENKGVQIMPSPSNNISFIIDGVLFEYDDEKNRINIQKHGLSFETAARVANSFERGLYYGKRY